jgi:fungal STAND N-terminal Goodbye domain
MSQILSTADPHLRFQCIYDKALKEYKEKTKKDLTFHPLFSRLNACHSADAILAVLRSQIRDFEQSTSSNDKLTKWLDPVVHVLYTFSATIGAGVGRVCFWVL